MKQLRIAEAALQSPAFVAQHERLAEEKTRRRYGCRKCRTEQERGKLKCAYCGVTFTDMDVELVP
jgi:hypothetical protein